MSEFQGLIDAEIFLGVSALTVGACLWFNRRFVAGMAMACVLAGFASMFFVGHFQSEAYIAGDDPIETFYHVAQERDGRLVSSCIHAPRGSIRQFRTQSEALKTGRVPCRCVNGKQNVMAGVTRPANR